MTMTDDAVRRAVAEPATAPLPAVTPEAPRGAAQRGASVLDQVGGVLGLVCSTVPVVVFVVANAMFALPAAITVALATAAVLTVVRLLRGERPTSAVGGLLGVGVAAGVAAWTGSASGFFLFGIWIALAGFVVVAGSLLVRRPLTGVLWNLAHDGGHAWRADRPSRRAHDLATAAFALVLGARFVVGQWLYLLDATGWLAVAKIAMGTPLTVLAALVTWWAFRRTSARLLAG